MTTNTNTNTNPLWIDKFQVAKLLGCGAFHANELMTHKKLGEVTKVAIKPGSKTVKKLVSQAKVEDYAMNRKGGIGKRADGRNKYTTYFSAAELQAFTDWAKTKGIPAPKRANPPKTGTGDATGPVEDEQDE